MKRSVLVTATERVSATGSSGSASVTKGMEATTAPTEFAPCIAVAGVNATSRLLLANVILHGKGKAVTRSVVQTCAMATVIAT